MTEYVRSRPRDAAERVYRLLLLAYPRDFRDELGDAMAEFFRDRLRDARAQGRMAVLALWLRAVQDTTRNAVPARLDSLLRRARRAHEGHQVARRSHLYKKDWMLSSITQDIRYALRAMAAQRGFTAVVLITLMLGIGANAAIFSVVNGVLLRPLPYADPDRLVAIAHTDMSVSEPEFADYKRDGKSLSDLSAWSFASANITGDGEEPERVDAVRVSHGFFSILGVSPRVGRAFTADEDTRAGPSVIILSYGLWQRRYGGDPAIVGKDVMVNGRPRTVVGVMPRDFQYPSKDAALWVPLRLNFDSLWTRNNHYLQLIGRVAPHATLEQATTELTALAARMSVDYPDVYEAGKPLVPLVTPVEEALLGKSRPYLYALLGAVGFVLLIACVNVANLLLARGQSRRKDVAIRVALGASRTRILRQALTESAAYSLIGGALGLALAWAGVRLLLGLAPEGIPRVEQIRIDLPVLLFTVLLSLVTGLIFGVVPAMRSARSDAADVLKEAGRTSGQGRGLARARSALVVAELALAVVMLAGAGLMLRSLWKLQAIDLGFDPSNVLTMSVSVPLSAYPDDRPALFYRNLLERVHALPGVTAAAAVNDLPIGDPNSFWSILIDGAPMTTVANAKGAMPQHVTPRYFEAMRVPVLRGRGFTEQDHTDAPMVVVVNETMAKKLWPGKDAIGGTVKMLNETAPWATVIGVVKDERPNGHLGEIPPIMYFPHAQGGKSAYFTPAAMDLVIRTSGDPLAIAPAVRRIVREMEPLAPIARVQSMEQIVARSIAGRRFTTDLLAGFAVLALVLAGIGVYGVISYGVTQRTFEIGLRMALGAERRQVLALVVRDGMRLVVIGLAVGVLGALAASRAIQGMLVSVGSADPITLVSVTLILVAVALVASLLPARRAVRVEPIGVLRGE